MARHIKFREKAFAALFCFIFIAFLWVNTPLIWTVTKSLSIVFPLTRKNHQFLNNPLDVHRVVVSMASFGERIENLPRVLSSLRNQTWVPNRILINVPLSTRFGAMSSSDVQDMVERLSSFLGPFVSESNITFTNGIFMLRFVERDYGPATKLLGALQVEKDPDTIIVTVDDDCEYHPQTVEALVLHAPQHGALGAQCEELPPALNVRAMFFFGGAGQASLYGGGSVECFGWLMGYAGVAFRSGHFGPDVFQFLDTAPAGCFLHDDVWLSGYLHRRGVPRYFHSGIPEPHHFSRHPTQSINSVPDTQVCDFPSVNAFPRVPDPSLCWSDPTPTAVRSVFRALRLVKILHELSGRPGESSRYLYNCIGLLYCTRWVNS